MMSRTTMAKSGFTLLLLCCLFGKIQAVETVITTIEGTTSTGELIAISASGEVKLGQNRTTALNSLSRIDFPHEKAASQDATTLFLQCGSILQPGKSVTLASETIQARLVDTDLELPIDVVKALRLQAYHPTRTLFEKGLDADSVADRDRVFLQKETELQEVSGLIESIGETHIALDRDGSSLKPPLENVYGIIFAAGPVPDLKPLNSRVTLVDGSLVVARVAGYEDGHLFLSLISGATVRLPEHSVRSLTIKSDRVEYLSDLKPKVFLHEPVLLNRSTWTADTNFSGGPIRLGETRHAKGIGMISGMELVFEVAGFNRFAAITGIDVDRRNRGDCEAVVLIDGREVFREHLRGGDEAKPLNIEIDGAKTLTLKAEPGENFDLSDHVNWAGARLLK